MVLTFFSLNLRQSWKLLLVSYSLKKVRAPNIVFSHLYSPLNCLQYLLYSTVVLDHSIHVYLYEPLFPHTDFSSLCWGGLSEFISGLNKQIFILILFQGSSLSWNKTPKPVCVTKAIEKKLSSTVCIPESISLWFGWNWLTGEVSDGWKLGNEMLLIYKKTRKEDLGTCRPISLTLEPGKVMEQIILSASQHMYLQAGDQGQPGWV